MTFALHSIKSSRGFEGKNRSKGLRARTGWLEPIELKLSNFKQVGDELVSVNHKEMVSHLHSLTLTLSPSLSHPHSLTLTLSPSLSHSLSHSQTGGGRAGVGEPQGDGLHNKWLKCQLLWTESLRGMVFHPTLHNPPPNFTLHSISLSPQIMKPQIGGG